MRRAAYHNRFSRICIAWPIPGDCWDALNSCVCSVPPRRHMRLHIHGRARVSYYRDRCVSARPALLWFHSVLGTLYRGIAKVAEPSYPTGSMRSCVKPYAESAMDRCRRSCRPRTQEPSMYLGKVHDFDANGGDLPQIPRSAESLNAHDVQQAQP